MSTIDYSGEGIAPSAEKTGRAFFLFWKRPRKGRRSWRRFGRGVLIFATVVLAIHTALNIYASVLLNRELAEIRRRGEPLSFIDALPPIPDADNAALVYQQAIAAFRLTDNEENLLSEAVQGTPPLSPKLQDALERNQKAIRLTRQASTMPACRFSTNWSDRPDRILLPYYAPMRKLSRLLSDDAIHRARMGDSATALTDVRAMYGMSRHLQGDPLLIGFLVARSMDAIANHALGRVLEIRPMSGPAGRAFEAALPPDNWSDAYHRTLLGERTFGIQMFDYIRADGRGWASLNGDQKSPNAWLWWPVTKAAGPFLKFDELYYLRYWKRSILDHSNFEQPPLPANSRQDIEEIPRYLFLSRAILPAMRRTQDLRDLIEVSRRQRTVALALSGYRAARGRYPATLAEAQTLWGEPLPLDFYGGKPFRYRRQGQSFMLYSVGSNGIDDGGEELHFGSSSSFDGDIPWIRPNRPQKR